MISGRSRSQRLTEAQIREAIRVAASTASSSPGCSVSRRRRSTSPRAPTPSAHYGGYYGYYGSSWDVVHEPGYYQTHTIVRLETNLYDVGTGELVWSGQSETFNPSSLKDSIDSVTKAVAKRLRKESLIP